MQTMRSSGLVMRDLSRRFSAPSDQHKGHGGRQNSDRKEQDRIAMQAIKCDSSFVARWDLIDRQCHSGAQDRDAGGYYPMPHRQS
jgi:hypothetical protein